MLDTIAVGKSTNALVKTRGPAEQVTASISSKLRDSCRACSESKVRCPKEKPACSRCKRRNIDCQYSLIKRPGRKRATSPSRKSSIGTSNNETINRPNLASPQCSTTNVPMFNTGSFSVRPDSPSSSLIDKSMTEVSPSADPFDDLVRSCSASSSVGVNCNFEGLLDKPLDAFHFDMSNSELVNCDINEFEMGAPPLSLSATGANMPSKELLDGWLSLSNPETPFSGADMPTIYVEGSESSTIFVNSCDCMKQALELMGNLFTTNSSADLSIQENTKSIESISTILLCSQTHDAYLLTILSMFISKIIDRYAGALSEHPRDGTVENSISNEGLQRMKAQSILGELHRVQGLVNQLSPKLEARRVEETTEEGRTHVPSSCSLFAPGDPSSAPFSAEKLMQIGNALRTSLIGLATEIISILRQI